MKIQQVILVNENDEPTGIVGKMEAHEKAMLHRAFSIFIFNDKGEMLLQQRAMKKYHSGGLWSNACCSHPQPGEETYEAAQRRLHEEAGFNAPLEKIFDFIYKVEFDNGLIEYEFDHVFVGEYEEELNFNKEEVMDFCYKKMKDIHHSLETHPQKYTAWFHLAFPKIEDWWNKQYKDIVA
jgi:isopentenyl-diphosphate delta-isomerase